MDKDTRKHNLSPDRRNTAPDARSAKTARKPDGADSIRSLLDHLDRPLEDIDWAHPELRGRKGEGPGAMLGRLRRQRRHRRALTRARKAAMRAFDVRPKLSNRKKATLMLGAGALGMAAFTGPPKPRKPFEWSSSDAQKVVTGEDDVRKPSALMKASDTFKQALIEEEGVRYTVYRDVAGYPTVGVGHLVRPSDNLRVGDRISESRMLEFLSADLADAERGVRELVGDLPLRQHEFDALLDLVFNVGAGNVSNRESPRLNAAIEKRDYQAIAAELDYTFAGGEYARGLEFRSERRAKIFLDAAYDNPREV